jgi:ATP adenylyltransferase
MNAKKLWAPWRIGYIKSAGKEKGCLFCRVFRSTRDKENLLVLRSKHAFVLLNLYPYNNGHIMVVPVRHTQELESLTADETADLMDTLKKAKRLLDAALKPDGYNIGINIGRASGAGIAQHLHIHVVPRWNGDTNFMASVGATKIISQSLQELYKILTKKST